MIPIILLLSIQIGVIFTQQFNCDQQTFRCESYLRQSDCPFNEFLEIDESVGCCPNCRGGLGTKNSRVK